MDSDNVSNNKKEESQRNQNYLKFIKNKYILKRIFNNVDKNIYLRIIKYNKYTQNQLNISINDYKEIEIQIIPEVNKYAKFINISEENKLHYHIYFNNNKEEIKRNYLVKDDKVQFIKVIIDYNVSSFSELFKGCKYNETINFKRFYRSNINNMSYMFDGCISLKNINFSSFNTINVTDMKYMFNNCSSLEEVNLSKFKTNKVTNMSFMFNKCQLLKSIKISISNFNLNNIINVCNMFCGCSSLKDIDLSNFNFNLKTIMNGLFTGCSDDLIMLAIIKINNIKITALK